MKLNRTDTSTISNGRIRFEYNGKNILDDLSEEDLNTIKEIFNNKKLYKDSPSCGFDDNIAILFNAESQVFCIARDTCPKTETASNETIEKATKRFLDGLLPSAAYLKNLAGKYNATLWISAYPETEQINLHLSQNTIKRIFDLGITLDFSIMFLKQFYDGTY